jgi:hypothetical protein
MSQGWNKSVPRARGDEPMVGTILAAPAAPPAPQNLT